MIPTVPFDLPQTEIASLITNRMTRASDFSIFTGFAVSADIWTPPALQGVVADGSGSNCGRYIRPLVASVEAGPDDIRSQEPHEVNGV
jgi:hypothetical protein